MLDLTAASKKVFGEPSTIDRTKPIFQSFSTVMQFINEWSKTRASLTEDDQKRFKRIISGEAVTGRPEDMRVTESALIHFSFAKKAYNKLVDIVIETNSDAAHDALERLQDVYASEIKIMNKSKCEHPILSPSSGLNHRQQGMTRQR